MQRIIRNLCCCSAAICKKYLPIGIFFGQIFYFCKVTVNNIIPCFIWVSKLHFIFWLVNICIIIVFLIYSNIVNHKLCIFFKLIILIWISYPATANCQIQYHIKWLIIRRGISNFSKSRFLSKPIIHCIEQDIIYIEPKLIWVPLTRKYMKFFPEIFLSFWQGITALLLCMWFPKMKGSIGGRKCTSMNLHHINLTTLWPLTIITLIFWHHPKCRQKSFSAWNLCAYFKSSILIIFLSLGIDSS